MGGVQLGGKGGWAALCKPCACLTFSAKILGLAAHRYVVLELYRYCTYIEQEMPRI